MGTNDLLSEILSLFAVDSYQHSLTYPYQSLHV